MKIKIMVGTIAMVVIAACWLGCGAGGSSGGSDDGGLSEDSAIALSGQVSNAAVNSMNNADWTASISEAEGLKSIQCSQDGSVCTYNVPINFTQSCTAGGRIAITGSITGSMSSGTGLLQIGSTATMSDWECITGYIINGDPYLSLSGTFSFMNGYPSTQQSMTINGGWKWGTTAAESCQVHLSINFDNSLTGGSMTGEVCGYGIDVDF